MDGYDTAYFTSEHNAQSLVTQMESIGLEASGYLPDKFQIYPLPERDEDQIPEPLLSTVAQYIRIMPIEIKFIVDSITELAAPCSEGAIIQGYRILIWRPRWRICLKPVSCGPKQFDFDNIAVSLMLSCALARRDILAYGCS